MRGSESKPPADDLLLLLIKRVESGNVAHAAVIFQIPWTYCDPGDTATLIPCNFAAVILRVQADKLREVLRRIKTVPNGLGQQGVRVL